MTITERAASPEQDWQGDWKRALKRLVFGAVSVRDAHGTERQMTLYKAAEGWPDPMEPSKDMGYPGNFSSDAFVAAEIADDTEDADDRELALEMTAAEFVFASQHQSSVANPITGAEPGKIHHELMTDGSAVIMGNGRSTAYSRCDTTALYMLAAGRLHGSSEYRHLAEDATDKLDQALGYIRSHVVTKPGGQRIFEENPALTENRELYPDVEPNDFALKVTTWKDSELNAPADDSGQPINKPRYPIAYSMAHFMNAAAVRRLGEMRGDQALIDEGEQMMRDGINYFWKDDHFIQAIDADRVIDAPQTDSLYSLLYIPPEILQTIGRETGINYAEKIEQYSQQLETDYGYRTALPSENMATHDRYHLQVWVHEQAMLDKAAARHGLQRARHVTQRITRVFVNGTFPELAPEALAEENERYDADHIPHGNPLQLWAVATYRYFQRQKQYELAA